MFVGVAFALSTERVNTRRNIIGSALLRTFCDLGEREWPHSRDAGTYIRSRGVAFAHEEVARDSVAVQLDECGRRNGPTVVSPVDSEVLAHN